MLSDLKVIELASVLAGPDVGMFFAEMGANVIKIENKTIGGDVTRSWKLSTEIKNTPVSAYFASVNWNKEYRSLDLKNKSDNNEVLEMIKTADIVIANFKLGADEELGMDYNSLKTINPTLIYGEINGFGKNSKRVAFDVVLQAETGFMSINGTPTSGPIKMPIALIDVLAAHQLKEGLLLALLKKEKTNKGSLVEVSLYDTAIASLKNQATNLLMNDFVPQRIGSLHPNIAPYGETFETNDKQLLVLAIGKDKHFKQLLTIIGASELIDDNQFKSNQLRVINRELLYEKLLPYFKKLNAKELMKQFISENIPVGIINNLQQVFENKEAQSLILEQVIDHRLTKRVKTAVFKISD